MLNVAAFPPDRHGIRIHRHRAGGRQRRVEFAGFGIDRSHRACASLASQLRHRIPGANGFRCRGSPDYRDHHATAAAPVIGGSVAITATLSGATTPTGMVQLVIDHGSASVPVILINGSATVNYAGFSAGPHTVGFNYSGDSNFLPFFDAVPIPGNPITIVPLVPTTITIGVAPGTVNLGNPVTISGLVTPTPGPAELGKRADYSGCRPDRNCARGFHRQLHSVILLSSAGVHTVAANYLGNSTWAASSNSGSLTVNKILPPLITISTLPVAPAVGVSVAITIVLSPASGFIPTGQVQLVIDHGTVSILTLVNGSSTFTYPGFSFGSHTIGFNYSGDNNYLPFFDAIPITGNPITLQVNKFNQVITVTSSAPASAAFNGSFSVAATAPGGTVAIGVTGPCSINAGTVTMTSASGTCAVTFSQSGNASYNAARDIVQNTNAIKADQTISVTSPAPATAVYNSTFPVAATARAPSASV
jgi:hypothetical protein